MKIFNFQKYKLPYITVLALALPLSIYFFSYVPAKRDYVISRDFRILGDMSVQIKSKVENLTKVLHGAASNAQTIHDSKHEDGWEQTADSLKKLVTLAQDIQLIDNPVISQDDVELMLHEHEHDLIFLEKSAYEIKPHLRLEGDSFWLHFEYDGFFEESNLRVTIRGKSNLANIIGPIVSRDIFDDVVLTERNGNVIYQKNPMEVKATKFDNFTDRDSNPIEYSAVNQSSHLLDMKLGGKNYKLFIQPLQLFFLSSHEHETNHHEQAKQLAPDQAQNTSEPETTATVHEHAKELQDEAAPHTTETTRFSNPGYVNWTLCGLVRRDRFTSETRAISYSLVIGFIFVVLILGLSWPLIKIIYIGPKDRLRVAEIFFLTVSVFLGTAVLTFMLADCYYYKQVDENLDGQLKDLAHSISENFYRELVSAHAQLQHLTQNKNLAGNEKFRLNLLANEDHRYPYFEMAAWTDPNGKQTTKWTVRDKITPFIDVSKREYFKAIRERRFWSIVDTLSSDTLEFMLEPIYSWTTGENETVLSIPDAPTHAVATLVFRPQSLIRPVVPSGFGFCVIDRQGDVLYHSDVQHNLRENFFRECDDKPLLRSAVFAHAAEFVNVDYLGSGYRAYVTPILEQLPWFLVVFQDKEIIRTVNLEIVTISMILFLAYSFIFLGLLGLYYLLRKKFNLNWAWPDKAHQGSYIQLMLVYLFLSVFYIFWIFHSNAYETLYALMLLPPFVVILTYMKLRQKWVLANWKRNMPYLLVAFVPIVFVLLGFLMFHNYAETLLLTTSLLLCIFFLHSAKISGVFERRKVPDYRLGFVLTCVSLLLLISVLPTMAFFKIAFDQEIELFIRSRQISFAESLQSRAERIRLDYLNIELPDRENFLQKRLNFSKALDIYLPFYEKKESIEAFIPSNSGMQLKLASTQNQFIESAKPDTCVPRPDTLTQSFKKFLLRMRPYYNKHSIATHSLVDEISADGAWKWIKLQPDEPSPSFLKNSKKYLLLHKNGYDNRKVLHLTSVLPVLTPPINLTWWLGLLAILLVLFILLRFISQRVFLLDLNVPSNLVAAALQQTEISHNILVIGPPSCGKSKFLETRNVPIIDLVKEANKNGWATDFDYGRFADAKVVAIDHLEYKMDDPTSNYEKLIFLENLTYSHKKRIILVSNQDPVDYLLGDGDDRKNDESAQDQKNRNRWASILSSFLRMYVEDDGDANAFTKIVSRFKGEVLRHERKSDKKERTRIVKLFDVLLDECSPSQRLQSIGKELVELQGFIRLAPEQLINQILDWAESYYRAIWETCTQDEKLLLVHLAEDGFANAKNANVIRKLLRRNLIVQTPDIQLMNESFKRFVLTVHSPEEVATWERQGNMSSWKTLRGPLVTILIGVVLFLLTTQQEILQTTIAVVSASAALIPALIKLLGFFQERKGVSVSQS